MICSQTGTWSSMIMISTGRAGSGLPGTMNIQLALTGPHSGCWLMLAKSWYTLGFSQSLNDALLNSVLLAWTQWRRTIAIPPPPQPRFNFSRLIFSGNICPHYIQAKAFFSFVFPIIAQYYLSSQNPVCASSTSKVFCDSTFAPVLSPHVQHCWYQ